MRLHPQRYDGGGIYWLTIPLCVGLPGPRRAPACGMYLVDTGGFSTITVHDAGTPDTATVPKTHTYGSGTAAGWPTVAPVRFAYETQLPAVALTHKVHSLPFAGGIDGVLGLMPGQGSVAAALSSIQIDFRANELYFNQPNIHEASAHARIVHTPGLHRASPPLPGERLWIRGSISLLGPGVNKTVVNSFEDVWMLLDTGATVAMTFVDRRNSLATVKECNRTLDIQTLRLTGADGSATLDVPMPRETLWPSCVPTQQSRSVAYIILGIQLLSKLRFLYYTIEKREGKGSIGSVCIGI